MATTYQDTPPQFFKPTIPNNSNNVKGYYVTVNESNGETTIFRKSTNLVGQEQIESIGSIPKAGGGGFANTGRASKEEIQYFTDNARKTVTDQAVPVVRRGIGGQSGGGDAKVNSILGTQLSTQQTNPDTGDKPAPPLLPTNDISVSIPDDEVSESIDESLRVQLRYPLSMDGSQDRIKFSVKKFIGRKNINITGDDKFKLGERDLSDILGFVFLPIQPSINDSNGVDWGGANLNPIQAYAASASLQMMNEPGGITGAAAEALRQAAIQFKTGLDAAGYGKAINLYLAQEAVGTQNLLSRTSGALLNPNLELLFNGPTLRPFNFTFRLSPRSGPEAEQVKKIINFFKKAMAVKKAKSEVFLKAPNVFEIEYQSGEGKLHESLNKIKTCALLGCDVDYTPDGTYMTFNDEKRTMTSYQLTLRFSELDPVYNTDYAIKHSIGY
jgi:hypothetical protein